MENIDFVAKAKEVWQHPEIQALARRCFNKKFNCTPVIMEKVCASGSKCFHDIHYLFQTEKGCPISSDACPINCVVSNFVICGVGGEPCPPGVSRPRRAGECIIFTVKYKVRVWFEFFDKADQCLEVGMASECFTRELAIPVEDIDGGCVLCNPEAIDLCIRRIKLDCIHATVVPKPAGYPKNCPPYAIEVTVEKEFFALESGRSIICVPTCAEECIDLPFPILAGECIPFEREAQCEEFCEETDLEPGRCAQCPPPQP
ncbi:MAG: hypothetical protein PHX01_04920 [Clostridia bacterium]|nr:hypothetical protein [Clostridia bacterium]